MGKTDSSDEPKFTLREPRKVNHSNFDEDALRRISEGGRKGGSSEASRPKLQKWWMDSFLANNPLKEGEAYIRWTNKRTGWRHAAKVDDRQRVEYSRDGVNWKVAKRANPERRKGGG